MHHTKMSSTTLSKESLGVCYRTALKNVNLGWYLNRDHSFSHSETETRKALNRFTFPFLRNRHVLIKTEISVMVADTP